MHLQKSFIRILIGTCVLLAGLGCVESPKPPVRQPKQPSSVILISLDTLRADRLGLYGSSNPTSPHLDALARDSVVFEQAYSTSPWTLPAHTTMFTGVLPPILSPWDWEDMKNSQLAALPEIFRKNGYAAGGFVDSVLVSPKFGFDDSFKLLEPGGSERITREAVSWVSSQKTPYFLFLHIYDAHFPYDAPPPFKDRFQTPPTEEGRELLKSLFWPGEDRPPVDSMEAVRDRYDEQILFLDSQLGRFFDFLKDRGDYNSSLIVVTSDHGESFGDHGLVIGHGRFLFEEAIHIPLIVKMPGPLHSRRVNQPVSLLDLVPTILEIQGLPLPAVLQGRSLLTLLQGNSSGPVPVFSRSSNLGGHVSVRFENWKWIDAPKVPLRYTLKTLESNYQILYDPQAMIKQFLSISPDSKKSQNPKIQRLSRRIPDSERLFDLAQDPKELHNLASEHPDILEKMKSLAKTETARWDALAHELKVEKKMDYLVDLTDEERGKLRALGYLN